METIIKHIATLVQDEFQRDYLQSIVEQYVAEQDKDDLEHIKIFLESLCCNEENVTSLLKAIKDIQAIKPYMVVSDPSAIAFQLESNPNHPEPVQSAQTKSCLDCDIKKRILQQHMYHVHDPDHCTKYIPMKFESKPKVRYRNNEIVSNKGERFV
jgi:hypothetical protein